MLLADPEERTPAMAPFSTRHTSTCHFSHMDTSGIPFLGYLPQDITGYSVFDFYHADDLSLMRDIYELGEFVPNLERLEAYGVVVGGGCLVATRQGASFRSKPYRFKAFNGDFVTIETEWSCFINPWSRKFEFVVGQHRILTGPLNPNVFEEAEDFEPQPVSAQGKKYQQDILYIL